jgi:hypothetical protein
VTAHAIFGTLDPAAAPPRPGSFDLTLVPPAPGARLAPFYTHPAHTTPLDPEPDRLTFHKRVIKSHDPAFTPSDAGGIEGAEYWSFATPAEGPLAPAALALFADLFPSVRPRVPDANGETRMSWYPTLTLALEFKSPVPAGARALGVFAAGRFVSHPSGRHDVLVEMWSAPGPIGEGEVREGWKEGMRCLAVARQVALTVPFEVNRRRATGKL